jgi:hypothetical protein
VDDKKLMRGGRKTDTVDGQALEARSSEEEVSLLAGEAAALLDEHPKTVETVKGEGLVMSLSC